MGLGTVWCVIALAHFLSGLFLLVLVSHITSKVDTSPDYVSTGSGYDLLWAWWVVEWLMTAACVKQLYDMKMNDKYTLCYTLTYCTQFCCESSTAGDDYSSDSSASDFRASGPSVEM